MNRVAFFALACLIAFGLPQTNHAKQSTSSLKEATTDKVLIDSNQADSRKRVVIIRPIVLCDDDGTNPAAFSLPKGLVDRVYTKADLEFLYMPVQNWNYTVGRGGKVNLDTIVRRGLSNGIICPDKRVVTLLFVANVDGNQGPLGRGMQNGNICFVCLGPDPANNEPGMEEFVIAHEVGHCLNLRHTVDDPNVPNDLVNLQGDGPFLGRLAVEGLHDTQRDTVLKSPLVNERVRFYSRKESSTRLVDETWEPYLSGATGDMLRFSLGLAANASLPESPGHRIDFAKQQFNDMAGEFSDEEKETLTTQIEQLSELAGQQWPLVTRFPWNFIKVESGFCSDFPHTRGLSIVLSPKVLQRMKADPAYGMTILLHEKIHVLQRINGPSFEKLYEQYGYTKCKLNARSISKMNLAQNPDALSSTWAFQIDKKPHLLATEIENKDNRLTFAEKLFPLTSNSDGSFSIESAVDVDKAEQFKNQFVIPTGHDHPNEVAAHTSRYLLLKGILGNEVEASELNKRFAETTRTEFMRIFALIGDAKANDSDSPQD